MFTIQWFRNSNGSTNDAKKNRRLHWSSFAEQLRNGLLTNHCIQLVLYFERYDCEITKNVRVFIPSNTKFNGRILYNGFVVFSLTVEMLFQTRKHLNAESLPKPFHGGRQTISAGKKY